MKYTKRIWIAQDAPLWLAWLYYRWSFAAYWLALWMPAHWRMTLLLLPAHGVWANSASFEDWVDRCRQVKGGAS